MNSPIIKRNSRSQMFSKIDVLINFERFTGKHQRRSFFFNKVARADKSTFAISIFEISSLQNLFYLKITEKAPYFLQFKK